MIRTCPICNMEFSEPPALSRLDNESLICTRCSQLEALSAAGFVEEQIRQLMEILVAICK